MTTPRPSPHLTPAEHRQVDALLEGLSSREISARLGLTILTVQTYQKRIYAKFGVHSKIQLVKLMRDEKKRALAQKLREKIEGSGVIDVEFLESIFFDLKDL